MSDDEQVALNAIKVVFERGLGKVPDQIEMSGPAGGPLRITFEAVVPVKEQHVIELDEAKSTVHIVAKAIRGISK